MKIRIRRFTLIELLAAMSVFSVLLLVCMRIFSGAQTMWVRSEQKNNAFANVRSAMEFISSKLQTIVCVDDMPFELTSSDGSHGYEKIYFATAMPMERKDSNGKEIDKNKIRFLSFQLESGKLSMRIYSDRGNSAFAYLIPPFDESNPRYKTQAKALNVIKSKCDSPSYSEDNVALIENVTALKMTPYSMISSGSTYSLSYHPSAQLTVPPFVLEIEISVMDSAENYTKWSGLTGTAKSDFEQEHGYSFRRAVVLNDLR